MSLLAANTRTRPGIVAQLNPVAKLAASAVIALPLIVTLDWVSAAVALALESVLFLFAGLRWREFWMRTWPVWLAAPLTALTIALYGAVDKNPTGSYTSVTANADGTATAVLTPDSYTVSGTVSAVNETLSAAPESINADPYGAWLIEVTNATGFAALMDASDYEAFCANA